MRAYSTQEGEVLWDFDTTRQFKTVNAMKAHGVHSMDPEGARR
jgi:hypothetical protein